MPANASESRIAELEAEIRELRRLLAAAENRTADDAIASTQRSIHHARELTAERERTAAADLRSTAEAERADRAEAKASDVEAAIRRCLLMASSIGKSSKIRPTASYCWISMAVSNL